MSPVIAAALIGVGGAVIVAVVGFLTTRAITSETIRANTVAISENRLWDKRAIAYETALAELAKRGARLSRALLLAQDSSTPPAVLEEYFDTEDTPAWSEAQGRLMAYASHKVSEALDAARFAHSAALAALVPLRKAVQEAVPLLTESGGSSLSAQEAYLERVGPAYSRIISALNENVQCDRALIDLIRAELQGERVSAEEAAAAIRQAHEDGGPADR